jgi:hypothetical protein
MQDGSQVEIEGVDEVVLMDFIHTGKLGITTDNAESLLAAAEMLLLDSAKKIIENFLSEHIDTENAGDGETVLLAAVAICGV